MDTTIEDLAGYYAAYNVGMRNAVKDAVKYGARQQAQRMYSEQEVLHLLDTLWDRLDRWYNETEDNEFNLRKWFDECELKKK